MRLVGAVILSLTAIFTGLHLAGRLKQNQRQIEMSLLCLEDIKSSIRYVRKGSRELIDEMSRKYAQLDWLSGQGSGQCFELGQNFCKGLGTSDLEGQMEHCDLFAQRFRNLLDASKKEREEKERLYISLGFFSGLALFILFI